MSRLKYKAAVRRLTISAMLTALVILFQYLGQFVRLGQFSVSLVLIPIVLGAALVGPLTGAWLGAIFGIMVFVTGDAAFFLTYSIHGTIITVMLKGILAGLLAGLAYRLLEKYGRMLATVVAAIVCPVINTGVFTLGTFAFFMPAVEDLAGSTNAILFIFTGLIGLNFFFELIFNIVLSPVVVRLVNILSPEERQ